MRTLHTHLWPEALIAATATPAIIKRIFGLKFMPLQEYGRIVRGS
jgi:hypothetical protein